MGIGLFIPTLEAGAAVRRGLAGWVAAGEVGQRAGLGVGDAAPSTPHSTGLLEMNIGNRISEGLKQIRAQIGDNVQNNDTHALKK